MKKTFYFKIKQLVICFAVMFVGAVFFKYIPMSLFGDEILYDASAHIISTVFILYVLWYFVDQNVKWRIPYFVFCSVVLAVVGFQRIFVNAHNSFGVLLGLVISLLGIVISRWDYFRGKFEF